MKNLNSLRKKVTLEKTSNFPCITISSGTCGQARGSLKVIRAFQDELKKHKLEEKIKIKVTGCHGFCEAEPNLIIYPEQIFYRNVKPEDAEEIILDTVMNNKIIERLVITDSETGKKTPYFKDIPFYKKQYRLIQGNNTVIDPTEIDDYLFVGGYKALEKALSKMNPDQVIEIIKQSKLRGRGGAGFPSGDKWSYCRKAKGDIKYVICNADEGDPGAYMDRSLLEGNPHSVLEGMIIGAFAIGANEGWIYVREEYPLAVKNITLAIQKLKEFGLLGKDILGSGFDFDIKIAKGAGAFVCGEETALIASIEGKRGIPIQRPPFPVQKGLYGKPTNINNVETWANVPLIIKEGADWYSNIGTKTSKGTKIFSLVGKVRDTGLVEVPMGITLREIIYDIGGGIPDGKKFKAVQTGGPSGGCIPQELIDLPVDYDSLTQAGSIMGSGGMIVMDESTCMVDIAKYFLKFLLDESCGKCLPCRKGIQKMLEIVTDISEGKGKLEDLETLEELAQVVQDTSLCGLGQTAPNPVLSTLRYFKNEYLAHINENKCPAGVCKELIQYTIDNDKCTACLACKKACPQDAIIGELKKPDSLLIIQKKCIKCGMCYEVCKFDSVIIS